MGDGDRPFRGRPHRDTGDSQDGRLLLDAPRVRQHGDGAVDQSDEVQVAERLDRDDAGRQGEVELGQALGRARVHREHQGTFRRHCAQRIEQALQRVAVVDVGRTMEGHHGVLRRSQPELPTQSITPPAGVVQVRRQRVDHDVAHEVHPVPGHPLGSEVVVGVGRGREQPARHRVGEDPVDLLGHLAITRTQARLDVGYRDVQLDGGERRGQGRVDVTHDDHGTRWPVHEVALVGGHDLPGLFGMGPRPDAEVHVGVRDPEIVEEAVRHAAVVVLAGVHQFDLEARGQRRDHRRDLHEVRPGGRDHADAVGHGTAFPEHVGAGWCRPSGRRR